MRRWWLSAIAIPRAGGRTSCATPPTRSSNRYVRARSSWRTSLDFARKKKLPVGVNVESVSIRKVEIEALVVLFHRLKARLRRQHRGLDLQPACQLPRRTVAGLGPTSRTSGRWPRSSVPRILAKAEPRLAGCCRALRPGGPPVARRASRGQMSPMKPLVRHEAGPCRSH